MGRLFREELGELIGTAEWASTTMLPTTRLESIPASEHLIAVGSGGSHSAAVYAALLHRMRGGQSTIATPLELIDLCYTTVPEHVILASAGGGNKDIVAAGQSVVQAGAKSVHAICMSKTTKLGDVVRTYFKGFATELEGPSGRDGFLATNSLLATMIVFARSFGVEVSSVPQVIQEKITQTYNLSEVLARPEWIVLHGGWAWPAAHDLESKCSEAALRTVQLSDLRNFGHGRHHWLAKRPNTSGVIVLSDPSHHQLAKRTVALVPKDVPVVFVTSNQNGPLGAIELMPFVYSLVHQLGQAVGIDPGRPGVPEFGRHLYHLGPGPVSPPPVSKTSLSLATFGAKRKLGVTPLSKIDVDVALLNAGKNYLKNLSKATFGALVLDYDGTIVDAADRYAGPRPEISQQLNRLLNDGLVLGIATGRGKSVRSDLRRTIDEQHWDKVLIGYYNGGQVIPLDGLEPDSTSLPNPNLARIVEVLHCDRVLSESVRLEPRPTQISVIPLPGVDWKNSRRRLMEVTALARVPDIKILESTHSIDILPYDVSKLSVVRACENLASRRGMPTETIRIGDCGSWPGNDVELLASGWALSVDACSSDPLACWNLLPMGMGGAAGTVFYLSKLHFGSKGFRFEVNK